MSEVRITPGGSDFRLMDRKAVDALNSYHERARFIRGMVNNLGFRTTTLPFVAPPRFAGHSKFNLRKCCVLPWTGLRAFPGFPCALLFMQDSFWHRQPAAASPCPLCLDHG